MIIWRKLTCLKCGFTTIARFNQEFGFEDWIDDEKVFCRECGSEMEVGSLVTERDLKEAV